MGTLPVNIFMDVCNAVDRCIELFEGSQLQGLVPLQTTATTVATIQAADLLETRERTMSLLTDDQIRAAVRVKRRCSVAGCSRITMPLTSVCKYHLAGSSAVAFGPCGYPGCTAPVANMKLLSKEHDALCPLHVSASSLQNSDERMQSASRFFQKQPVPGDHQLDALVMGTCDELVRHYARDRDLFSVFSVQAEEPEANICCHEMVTQVIPISGAHANACVKSMVDQIQYLCAAIQMNK